MHDKHVYSHRLKMHTISVDKMHTIYWLFDARRARLLTALIFTLLLVRFTTIHMHTSNHHLQNVERNGHMDKSQKRRTDRTRSKHHTVRYVVIDVKCALLHHQRKWCNRYSFKCLCQIRKTKIHNTLAQEISPNKSTILQQTLLQVIFITLRSRVSRHMQM